MRWHVDLLSIWDDIHHPIGSDFHWIRTAALLNCGAKDFGIRPEELFQRLRIPAGDLTNRIGSLAVFLTIPEVLPKMGQMIERVGIDVAPLLHQPTVRQ